MSWVISAIIMIGIYLIYQWIVSQSHLNEMKNIDTRIYEIMARNELQHMEFEGITIHSNAYFLRNTSKRIIFSEYMEFMKQIIQGRTYSHLRALEILYDFSYLKLHKEMSIEARFNEKADQYIS